jgi:hypothetical protein
MGGLESDWSRGEESVEHTVASTGSLNSSSSGLAMWSRSFLPKCFRVDNDRAEREDKRNVLYQTNDASEGWKWACSKRAQIMPTT